jgi:hypothetical protein
MPAMEPQTWTKHPAPTASRGSSHILCSFNEIILVNSHDGSTSYQMMAGAFRFVCTNGLICGDLVEDIRVRHSGNIVDNVIEGAYSILDQFGNVEASKKGMKSGSSEKSVGELRFG